MWDAATIAMFGWPVNLNLPVGILGGATIDWVSPATRLAALHHLREVALSTLGSLDEALFHSINNGLGQTWLDAPMMFISNKYTWLVVGVLILLLALLNRRRRLLPLCLLLGSTIGLTDVVTYQVVKPLVARERPCKRPLPELRMVPIWCGGDYGMPSNHAANGMALTVILALNAPAAAAWVALVLTVLTGFSRVYLGVHFPGDVLAGFGFGAMIGCAWQYLFWRLWPALGSLKMRVIEAKSKFSR